MPENSMGPVEKCLRDSGMDKRDVHEVVLVGGSTRIPNVQSMIQKSSMAKCPASPPTLTKLWLLAQPSRQRSSLARAPHRSMTCSSQIEIDRTVQEAEKFGAEDESTKAKIGAKNGLVNCCFTMRNTLSEEKLKDKFEGGDKEKRKKAVQDTLDWLKKTSWLRRTRLRMFCCWSGDCLPSLWSLT